MSTCSAILFAGVSTDRSKDVIEELVSPVPDLHAKQMTLAAKRIKIFFILLDCFLKIFNLGVFYLTNRTQIP